MFDTSKKSLAFLVILCTMALVAACATPGPKTTVGGLGGAAAGGLIGAAAGGGGEAIAAGAILGGLLGGVVGDRLDAADRRQASQAAYGAFEKAPVGSRTAWHNPDTGHSGSFTPLRTYQTAEGTPCREFQQTIIIDGQREQAYGTACRQPDGGWKIVEN